MNIYLDLYTWVALMRSCQVKPARPHRMIDPLSVAGLTIAIVDALIKLGKERESSSMMPIHLKCKTDDHTEAYA
jgi:hypothetical protein